MAFPKNVPIGYVHPIGERSWRFNGQGWDLQTISEAQVARAEAAAADATEAARIVSEAGVIQPASPEDVSAGESRDKAVTPHGLQSAFPTIIEYEDRAQLREIENRRIALVRGLGLFCWRAGATDPDDDETAFSTASGAWTLESISWEVAHANWLEEIELLREAERARIIRFEYTSPIASVAASASATYTIECPDAQAGDGVILTPPDTAAASYVLARPRVVVDGSIFVRLTEPTGTARTVSGTWAAHIIKVGT